MEPEAIGAVKRREVEIRNEVRFAEDYVFPDRLVARADHQDVFAVLVGQDSSVRHQHGDSLAASCELDPGVKPRDQCTGAVGHYGARADCSGARIHLIVYELDAAGEWKALVARKPDADGKGCGARAYVLGRVVAQVAVVHDVLGVDRCEFSLPSRRGLQPRYQGPAASVAAE